MPNFAPALHVLRAAAASTSSAAAPLSTYNVDPSSVSVSGLSSGGSFTVQLGVAYSSIFQTGFGVFAGQPYDCARNQSFHLCSDNRVPDLTIPDQHLASWSGKQLDPLSNLNSRKVYLWVGDADTIVGPNVMNQTRAQLAPYVKPANLEYTVLKGAVHTFPTDRDYPGLNPCTRQESPYISNCAYDGAGEVLKWMYGTGLKARNTGTLGGKVVGFAQSGALGAEGLAATGYLYVPAACAAGGSAVCKLHVALHGCSQDVTAVGMEFVEGTGYNLWADTNNIIVLYPQTMPIDKNYTIFDGLTDSYEKGCWDWLGFFGQNCDQKGGVQMAAVVAQVQKIISGYKK